MTIAIELDAFLGYHLQMNLNYTFFYKNNFIRTRVSF